MMSGTEKWRAIWHFAPAVLVGACGFALSAGASYVASKSETRAVIQEFDSRATNQAIVLQNGIDDYWSELYAVQALFASSNLNVTREEFEDFGRSL